jgi:hypothetical protein
MGKKRARKPKDLKAAKGRDARGGRTPGPSGPVPIPYPNTAGPVPTPPRKVL